MEKILDYNKKKFFRYSGKGNKFDQKKNEREPVFSFLDTYITISIDTW